MLDIDLQSDLNMEDDEGLNWSLLRDAADPEKVRPGAVLRAGRPSAGSWVRIVAVDDDGQVHFGQISGDEARQSQSLPAAG
ncbi:MAG TPA: hypothetical protein VGG09_14710 [Acidimicrobiales bacterium]|jgi:hypothetical protein